MKKLLHCVNNAKYFNCNGKNLQGRARRLYNERVPSKCPLYRRIATAGLVLPADKGDWCYGKYRSPFPAE